MSTNEVKIMEHKCNIPIGFFIFNRLDTAIEVFECIRKAKPEKLYLISDGPRIDRINEDEKVQEVRDYIERNIDWPCEVKKNYAEQNLGCRMRMASGITWLFENEEMAIVLEDNVKPTECFFEYMEEMLLKYKDDERIMLVSGFKIIGDYPIDESCTFSRHPMIWGWGTWRRAWNLYNIDIPDWKKLKRNGCLKKYFNFFGYIKASRDFDSVYYHKKDTWDFQWCYTVLKNDGLAIIPKFNLIENLGFGRADATHTTGNTNQDFTTHTIERPYIYPSKIEENVGYDEAYLKYGWGIKAIFRKVMNKLVGNK